MKTTRNIKLRTFCGSSADLALMRNHNPLIRDVALELSNLTTADFLAGFKTSTDVSRGDRIPLVLYFLGSRQD